jgi:hypothetical protein
MLVEWPWGSSSAAFFGRANVLCDCRYAVDVQVQQAASALGVLVTQFVKHHMALDPALRKAASGPPRLYPHSAITSLPSVALEQAVYVPISTLCGASPPHGEQSNAPGGPLARLSQAQLLADGQQVQSFECTADSVPRAIPEDALVEQSVEPLLQMPLAALLSKLASPVAAAAGQERCAGDDDDTLAGKMLLGQGESAKAGLGMLRTSQVAHAPSDSWQEVEEHVKAANETPESSGACPQRSSSATMTAANLSSYAYTPERSHVTRSDASVASVASGPVAGSSGMPRGAWSASEVCITSSAGSVARKDVPGRSGTASCVSVDYSDDDASDLSNDAPTVSTFSYGWSDEFVSAEPRTKAILPSHSSQLMALASKLGQSITDGTLHGLANLTSEHCMVTGGTSSIHPVRDTHAGQSEAARDGSADTMNCDVLASMDDKVEAEQQDVVAETRTATGHQDATRCGGAFQTQMTNWTLQQGEGIPGTDGIAASETNSSMTEAAADKGSVAVRLRDRAGAQNPIDSSESSVEKMGQGKGRHPADMPEEMQTYPLDPEVAGGGDGDMYANSQADESTDSGNGNSDVHIEGDLVHGEPSARAPEDAAPYPTKVAVGMDDTDEESHGTPGGTCIMHGDMGSYNTAVDRVSSLDVPHGMRGRVVETDAVALEGAGALHATSEVAMTKDASTLPNAHPAYAASASNASILAVADMIPAAAESEAEDSGPPSTKAVTSVDATLREAANFHPTRDCYGVEPVNNPVHAAASQVGQVPTAPDIVVTAAEATGTSGSAPMARGHLVVAVSSNLLSQGDALGIGTCAEAVGSSEADAAASIVARGEVAEQAKPETATLVSDMSTAIVINAENVGPANGDMLATIGDSALLESVVEDPVVVLPNSHDLLDHTGMACSMHAAAASQEVAGREHASPLGGSGAPRDMGDGTTCMDAPQRMTQASLLTAHSLGSTIGRESDGHAVIPAEVSLALPPGTAFSLEEAAMPEAEEVGFEGTEMSAETLQLIDELLDEELPDETLVLSS